MQKQRIGKSLQKQKSEVEVKGSTMPPSSDDDDDEKLRSVVVDFTFIRQHARPHASYQERPDSAFTSSGLNLCQTRTQDLLHDYLDKTFASRLAEDPVGERSTSSTEAVADNRGFHLFRHAPSGISIKSPSRKPALKTSLRECWKDSCDEEKEEFQSRLLAAAIDGTTVKAEAEKAIARVLSAANDQEAVAKEAARIEEERVALLKRVRGEEWLPAIARQMSIDEFENTSVIVDCINSKDFTYEAKHAVSFKLVSNHLPTESSKICKRHRHHDLKKDRKGK